jgi:lysophospholipase L1-like esterase
MKKLVAGFIAGIIALTVSGKPAGDLTRADDVFLSSSTNDVIDAAVEQAALAPSILATSNAFVAADAVTVEYLDAEIARLSDTSFEVNNTSGISTNQVGTPAFILVGDSLTAQNSYYLDLYDENDAGPLNGPDSLGYFNWARGFINSSATATNIAVGGYTSANVLSQTNTVINSDFDYVLLSIGINDVYTAGYSFETIRTNVAQALNAFSDNGKITFLLTVTPREATSTAAQLVEIEKYNTWAKNIHREFADVYPIDVTTPLLDFSDGELYQGSTRDNVHWSHGAASIIGWHVGQKINEVVPQCSQYAYDNGFEFNSGHASNIVDNLSLTNGSSWAVAGSGVTVSYTNNTAILDCSGGSNYARIQHIENISGGAFASNDTLRVMADISWDCDQAYTSAVNFFHPIGELYLRNVDNSAYAYRQIMYGASGDRVTIGSHLKNGRIVLESVPVLIGAGSDVDRVYITLGMYGISEGSITINNIRVWKD